MHHALNPDPYKGAFGNDGARYAEDVQDLIQTATSGRVAGFFAETIQVRNGSRFNVRTLKMLGIPICEVCS